MPTIATPILIVLGIIAFVNYRNHTLPDWLRAKFLNAGSDEGSEGLLKPSVFEGGVIATPAVTNPTGLGGGLGSLLVPVQGSVTGLFDEARPGHRHAGIDIAAPTGTPVAAARGGIVTYAGAAGDYGLRVDVSHGGDVVTRYAHLSQIRVRTGDQLAIGDLVGNVGSTGRATGPHLHFELRQGGKAVNPAPYLGSLAVPA